MVFRFLGGGDGLFWLSAAGGGGGGCFADASPGMGV